MVASSVFVLLIKADADPLVSRRLPAMVISLVMRVTPNGSDGTGSAADLSGQGLELLVSQQREVEELTVEGPNSSSSRAPQKSTRASRMISSSVLDQELVMQLP